MYEVLIRLFLVKKTYLNIQMSMEYMTVKTNSITLELFDLVHWRVYLIISFNIVTYTVAVEFKNM